MLIRSRPAALALTLLSALGVLALWVLFVTTTRGQALDQSSLLGSVALASLDSQARALLSLVSELSLVVVTALVVVLALAQRRWTLVPALVALIGGANVTTQLLKHFVLTRPDLVDVATTPNSLPSGHTTVAASLAVALVLAVPTRARAVTAVLAAIYAGATGAATLVAGWHRPSDVLAAFLVVGVWSGLVLTFTAAPCAPRRSNIRTALSLAVVGAGLLALSVLAGVVLSVTGSHVTAFAAGIFAVLGLAAWLFSGVLALRPGSRNVSPPALQ